MVRCAVGAYDLFSNFYDASLERLYAEHRRLAVQALRLRPGAVVLDVPCGTGQSFDALSHATGVQGLLLGVDASEGMLRRARQRAAARSLTTVRVVTADAAQLTQADLDAAAGRSVSVSHLHVFLGMSVFSAMESTFQHLWSLLAPGGRCVLVDVHAPRLGLQGWLVNKLARAEIRRRFWEPLELSARDFQRSDLPFRAQHGGQIMLATGKKPEP